MPLSIKKASTMLHRIAYEDIMKYLIDETFVLKPIFAKPSCCNLEYLPRRKFLPCARIPASNSPVPSFPILDNKR